MRSAAAVAYEEMKTEWDVDAAISTYNVDGWGAGYFTVNSAGNVEVRPLQEKGGSIDILEVVNEARNRGLGFPLVIRFQDLLRHRVQSVNCAFQNAVTEFGYKNHYRGVFPIKVNQLREVIEEIVEAGEEFHFGLEAGSTSASACAYTARARGNGRPAAARTPSSGSTPRALSRRARC